MHATYAQRENSGRLNFLSLNPASLGFLIIFLAVTTINASAGIITTIAGGGGSFTITNGMPATNVVLNGVYGLAPDLIGNLYLAHFSRAAVRRVNPTNGLLFTVAGTGNFGTGGDGGPAVDADVATPQSLAVDLTGNLYICDPSGGADGVGSIRKVDVNTGIITTLISDPQIRSFNRIAVDTHGNLYIADVVDSVVIKWEATNGLFHAIAGKELIHGHTGDGGPATNALLNIPWNVALDASDNIFILEEGPPTCIRRIDGVTGIITTVAGGGAGDGSSGLATNANLYLATDLAVDSLGTLYIGGLSNVWRVDLASGNIAIIAGGGTTGFAGDGGPATNALLNLAAGLAVSGAGEIYFTDFGNDRVRKITPDTVPPFQVLVDLTVSQGCLPVQTQVRSNLYLATVNGRLSLVLPNGTNVPGDVIVTNSTSLSAITVPAPAKVGGNLFISAGTNSTSWDLSQLTGVNGSLSFDANGPANFTAGSIIVNGPLTVTTGGSGSISLESPDVTGGLVVTSGGSGTVSLGNPSVTGGLTVTSGGSGSISLGNPDVTGGLVVTIGGSGTVSLGSPNVSGDMTVTNAGMVTFQSPYVTNNLTVVASGATNLDFSGAQVGGNTTLVVGDATTVSASTADGNTSVTLSNGPALMQAVLPIGTFTSNVVFTVESLATGSLTTVGTGTNATSLSVSPVAAYRFAFAVPTLNQDASLTFDITLVALAPAMQANFLAALESGLATMAVLGDAPGSVWQTFPVCDSGQSPSADGCVSLVKLDVTGTPLPPGSTNAPAVVRFLAVAGHFSTWGVVLVQPAASPVQLATTLLGDGTLRLSWTGPASGVLETSTNLAPDSWSPAGAPTQQPDGSWQLDVAPTGPARFYRFRAP